MDSVLQIEIRFFSEGIFRGSSEAEAESWEGFDVAGEEFESTKDFSPTTEPEHFFAIFPAARKSLCNSKCGFVLFLWWINFVVHVSRKKETNFQRQNRKLLTINISASCFAKSRSARKIEQI